MIVLMGFKIHFYSKDSLSSLLLCHTKLTNCHAIKTQERHPSLGQIQENLYLQFSGNEKQGLFQTYLVKLYSAATWLTKLLDLTNGVECA